MAGERNLVFWPKENAWSVVSNSAISDSDDTVGSLTSAKYGGKLYPALIIASKCLVGVDIFATYTIRPQLGSLKTVRSKKS